MQYFTSSSSPPAACKKCAIVRLFFTNYFTVKLKIAGNWQSVKRLQLTYSCRRSLSFFKHSNIFSETRRQNGQNVFT